MMNFVSNSSKPSGSWLLWGKEVAENCENTTHLQSQSRFRLYWDTEAAENFPKMIHLHSRQLIVSVDRFKRGQELQRHNTSAIRIIPSLHDSAPCFDSSNPQSLAANRKLQLIGSISSSSGQIAASSGNYQQIIKFRTNHKLLSPARPNQEKVAIKGAWFFKDLGRCNKILKKKCVFRV